jgi:hypothetical protein
MFTEKSGELSRMPCPHSKTIFFGLEKTPAQVEIPGGIFHKFF